MMINPGMSFYAPTRTAAPSARANFGADETKKLIQEVDKAIETSVDKRDEQVIEKIDERAAKKAK